MLQRENLPPDYNLAFDLSSPSVIYEVSGHFVPAKPAYLDSGTSSVIPESLDEALKIFGMMNVKYILSTTKLPASQNASLVFSDENGGYPTYIYENKLVLPRAYFVDQVDYQPDDDSAFSEVYSSAFDPSNSVILQTADKFQTLGLSKSSVDVTLYQDSEVDIKTQNKDAAILVLSDTNYPGWQAFIDGAATKIYWADYAYRAIYVPAGIHQIKFSYKPKSFEVGKSVTEISLGIMVVFIIFLCAKKIYKK